MVKQRIKPDEASRAALQAAVQNADRLAFHEEIRFLKRQQWAVTIAVMTLTGAIFSFANSSKLSEWVAIGLTLFLAASGVGLVLKLQKSLQRTRLAIDPEDDRPWFRGADLMFVLIAVMLLGAAIASYLLWPSRSSSEPIPTAVIVVTLTALAILFTAFGIWIGGFIAPPIQSEPWFKTYQSSVVGVIGPIVIVGAAWVAFTGVERQIANQRAISQDEQRPWLAADQKSLGISPAQAHTILLEVKNGGKSPGHNVCSSFVKKFTDSGVIRDADFPAECNGSRFLLLPGASKTYPIEITKDDIEMTAGKKSYLYILGLITYDDPLENSFYFWTKACWYWEIAYSQLTDCPGYSGTGRSRKSQPTALQAPR
jgi:hypothetical protein